MLTDVHVDATHNGVSDLAGSKESSSTKTVTLTKDENGFGLTICGGTDFPHTIGDNGIFVSDVSKHRDLPLLVGDRIIAANGHPLINVSHDKAIGVMKAAGSTVVLKIESTNDYKTFRKNAQSSPFKQIYDDGIILSEVPSEQASAQPPQNWCSQGIVIPLCILDDPSSLERIGRGSFGTVYLYKDTAYQVAIKHIEISTKQASKEAEYVSQEVELHKTLSHENIIQYFGSHQAIKYICIMMEYAEKGSLKECLQNSGRLIDMEILSYAKQILEGLNYLHTRIKPIIHRDLRSPNVLISSESKVKIADFGISKQLNMLATSSGFDTAVGNSFWQAPEMIERNKSIGKMGRKVDIWSMGITILEMIYVTPPFFKGTDYQYMYSLCHDRKLPEIPDFVDKKIRDMLGHCFVYCEKERKTAIDILRLIYGE